MSFSLKCMSFNLRVAVASDGVNQFFNRAPRVLEVLDKENPDLVGFQEVTDEMRSWLTRHLSGYTLQGCGRERTCHGESMLLGYRTGVCELLALENKWLSPTPDVPGSTFGGDQSSCPRMFTAVLLKHREAEKPFIFLNTHLDHKGAVARLLGAVEIMQYLSEKGYHFVITGDMNARPDAREIAAFTDFAPCGSAVVDATEKLGGTFHAFGKLEVPVKIDYIFTDMPCDTDESFIVPNEPIDGVYITDHCPVCSFVTAE